VDTSQCMVYSPKRVVATLGVEGLIIVDNQDSLLVCSKDRAQEIKQVVEALKVAGYQDLI
jgi:mannose-1-phosphate guanylyltransferase